MTLRLGELAAVAPSDAHAHMHNKAKDQNRLLLLHSGMPHLPGY